MPETELGKKISKFKSSFKDLFGITIHNYQSLSKTRDILLPKLMSGELRAIPTIRITRDNQP